MRLSIGCGLLLLAACAEDPDGDALQPDAQRRAVRDAGRFGAGGDGSERPESVPDAAPDAARGDVPDGAGDAAPADIGPDADPDPDAAPPDRDPRDAAAPDPALPDAAPDDDRPDAAPADPCDGRPDEGLPGCATVTGSWRWTITEPDGNRFVSLVALVNAGGRLSGRAIDLYGLAALDGRVAADLTFDLTKTYLAGASEEASFRYTGTLGDDALDGRYVHRDHPGQPGGALTATRAARIDPATVRGDWRLRADFADGEITFQVTDKGQVTGAMTDRVGRSTLDGVLDLDTGVLWFRKLYAQGTDFWYVAQAGGRTIEEGTYSDDSDSDPRGVWRAER